MADADLTPLVNTVTRVTTVDGSAKAMIDGIQQKVADAVAAATANGATAAELQPLSDLITSMGTTSDALAASIAANTPAAPPQSARR